MTHGYDASGISTSARNSIHFRHVLNHSRNIRSGDKHHPPTDIEPERIIMPGELFREGIIERVGCVL